jgi:predicted deacylase
MEAWNSDIHFLYTAGDNYFPTIAQAQGKTIVTTELGGAGLIARAVHELAWSGLTNVLRHFGVLEGEVVTRASLGLPPARIYDARGADETVTELNRAAQTRWGRSRWRASRAGERSSADRSHASGRQSVAAAGRGRVRSRHARPLVRRGERPGVRREADTARRFPTGCEGVGAWHPVGSTIGPARSITAPPKC